MHSDRKCWDDVEVRSADDVQRSVDAAVWLPDWLECSSLTGTLAPCRYGSALWPSGSPLVCFQACVDIVETTLNRQKHQVSNDLEPAKIKSSQATAGRGKNSRKKLKETDELEKSEEKQSSSLICKSLSEDCKFNFKADGWTRIQAVTQPRTAYLFRSSFDNTA